VFAISLVVILGTVFCDFPFFFDAELKSKWYWFYITLSFSGFLVLLPKRRNVFVEKRVDYRRNATVSIFASISIAASLVALYGLAQYAGLLPSGQTFKVTGNFDNPAGYASMLALSLPFVLYFTFSRKLWVKSVAWVIHGLCIAGIVLSGSRTGILVVLILGVFYVIVKYRRFITGLSWWSKSLLIVLAVVTMAGLYLAKKDSANGRFLVWRCTWDMIKEKPLFGHGYKSFEAEYMLYQARYFEQNPDSKFVLLSDNVKHPFNEYLLIVAEFGSVAIVVALLLIAIIIRAYIRNSDKESFTFVSAIIAILMFSCFSYPFKYPFTWAVFAFSIIFILKLSKLNDSKYGRNTVTWLFRVMIPLASFTALGFTIKDMYYENKWYNVANPSIETSGKMILPQYELLYSHFESDGYFLYNYAAQLNYWGEYEKSLKYADKCILSLNDYDIQMLIADNYHNLSDWVQGLEHYELASRMCSNRFMPLYKMTLIYDATGEKKKLRELAEKIIQKEEKIPSLTVSRIKNIMRKKLEEYNEQ
jgi:O-antigen ligase